MQDLFRANTVGRHIITLITQHGVSMMSPKRNIRPSSFICFNFVYNLTVSHLFGMT